jgi:hypothetical protein
MEQQDADGTLNNLLGETILTFRLESLEEILILESTIEEDSLFFAFVRSLSGRSYFLIS